jgi:two-component system, OmpR family, sensor kinase
MLLPLVATALALAGGLGATLYLHHAASDAVERLLDERLGAAGASASLLLDGAAPSSEALRALMVANALDAAYVIGDGRRVLADATGPVGRRADLLRLDPERFADAQEGRAGIGVAFEVDGLRMRGGYFPLPSSAPPSAVLVLEGGRAFEGAREAVDKAREVGLGLSLLGALALGAVSFGWARVQRDRRAQAEKSARAEALTRVAAMAAHEIRNPLGIIRGTVELMKERVPASFPERDHRALDDVLAEVERLRQLTDDLLELSADRPLQQGAVVISQVLEEVARAIQAAHPQIRVQLEAAQDTCARGDAARLRQVLLNLLLNAAQAQKTGEVRVTAVTVDAEVTIRVMDLGPGLSPEVQARLFEPFVTHKAQGTGLGLPVSKRLVERMGGSLGWVPAELGTTFELRLPKLEEGAG